MNKLEQKYLTREEIEKMCKLYNVSKEKHIRSRQINVLSKNLERILRQISQEQIIIERNAQSMFFEMVQNFMIQSRQEGIATSYNFLMLQNKASQQCRKQIHNKPNKVETPQVKPQVITNPQPEKKGFFGKLKAKLKEQKDRVVKAVEYAAAAGFALLSFGQYNQIGLPQEKKVRQEKTTKLMSKELQNESELLSKTYVYSADSGKIQDAVIPYPAQYQEALQANKKNYEKFVGNQIKQFESNITTLQNRKTDRKRFYAEQEKLIEKYGKASAITPQSSCESMSYATFLSVLDKEQSQDDYIAKACKDLLLKVQNPHACASSKQAFNSHYSANLRASMTDALKSNPKGIFMLWIKNKKGNLHRMTMIGTGDNEAYLLAYNNNRMVKMSIDNLDRLPRYTGYFCDLSKDIQDRANELAVSGLQNKQDAKRYMAFIYKQNKYRA